MSDDDVTMEGGDAAWQQVVGELRRAPRVDAAAIDRLMERVVAGGAALAVTDGGAPLGATRRRGVVAWLLQPRMVALTPAHAIAAALLLTVAIGGALRWRPASARVAAGDTVVAPPAKVAAPGSGVPVTEVAQPGSAPAGSRRVVQFVFVSRDARDVAIVGDFNDWQAGATPLRRVSPTGMWTVEVGLEPGRYTYAFVVDGTRWVPDEAAPRARDDEFGGERSIIYVRTQS